MRGKSKYIVLSLVLCLSMMLFLCGCGEEKSGSTIEEPEITGKYLQEEYSQQHQNDGAEPVVGYVPLEQLGEGDYSVHISERQVVASSEYKDGYYIADNNVAKDVTLGAEGRIACQKGKELNVVSADDFIQDHNDGESQLYTVYLMGDSAELILATDPADVETKQQCRGLCTEKNQDIRKRCGIVPAFFDTIKPLSILQEAERFYADTESSSVYNFSY